MKRKISTSPSNRSQICLYDARPERLAHSLLEHFEVCDQFVSSAVGAGVPVAHSRIGAVSGMIEPAHHAGDVLSEYLARVLRGNRPALAGRLECEHQRLTKLGRHTRVTLAGTQRPCHIRKPEPIATQRGKTILVDRAARHLVRHEGVAVAIASNPRSELEKRGDVELLAGIVLGQRSRELVVQRRHGLEQRLLEEIEAPMNLLLHGGLLQAQVIGHPEQLDLVAQRGHEPLTFAGRPSGRLKVDQQAVDPPMFLEYGHALGLGLVRREHRPDA